MATHHFADVAQQRQQQFRKLPGALPHESASLSVGSISKEESGLKNVRRRSGVARATYERLLSAIFLRPFASVAQFSARRASNAEVAGEIPAGSTNYGHVVKPE